MLAQLLPWDKQRTPTMAFLLYDDWIGWAAAVLSRLATEHGDLVTFLTVGTLVHESVFIGSNLLYTLLASIPSCRQRWKIQPKADPPKKLVFMALVHIYIFRVLVQLPSTAAYFYIWKRCGGSMHMHPPSAFTCCWQVLTCALSTEVMFYSSHRLFHHPILYKNLHKRHHEFKTPVGVSSEYANVVEDLVVNLPSTLLPPVVMGVHPLVLFLWLGLRILETVDAHSGMALPWSPFHLLPCFAGPLFHDYHHSATTKGAYGVLGLMDFLLGTDKDFKEHMRRRKLAKAATKRAS
ncbi:hypothetical protein VYU27_006164 [Nannochloropsis oceanica]